MKLLNLHAEEGCASPTHAYAGVVGIDAGGLIEVDYDPLPAAVKIAVAVSPGKFWRAMLCADVSHGPENGRPLPHRIRPRVAPLARSAGLDAARAR